MSLKISTLEPIELGEIIATPKVPQGLYFRLTELKFDSEEACKSSIDVLTEAFSESEKKNEIENFLRSTSPFNLQRISAYLLGGDEMLERIDQAISDATMKGAE